MRSTCIGTGDDMERGANDEIWEELGSPVGVKSPVGSHSDMGGVSGLRESISMEEKEDVGESWLRKVSEGDIDIALVAAGESVPRRSGLRKSASGRGHWNRARWSPAVVDCCTRPSVAAEKGASSKMDIVDGFVTSEGAESGRLVMNVRRITAHSADARREIGKMR